MSIVSKILTILHIKKCHHSDIYFVKSITGGGIIYCEDCLLRVVVTE